MVLMTSEREREMCATWRLMLEPCACEDETVKSLKINKSPGVDQIS